MVQDRDDKSLCEKSMKMVVNIIKLSSFSIAKMSLGSTGHPTATQHFKLATNSNMATHELLQFSGSQRSEKPQSSSKPVSFVMQPGGGNETLRVHEEKSDSDVMFAAYIKKVHEKNRRNMHEAAKLSPFILPPPPTPLHSRTKKIPEPFNQMQFQ